jgi:Zn-finger nucleic acid-binding protein
MQTREGLLCPVCRVALVLVASQGTAMACCPRCDGAWLDRTARATLLGDDPRPRQKNHGPESHGRLRQQDDGAPRPWRGALFDSD